MGPVADKSGAEKGGTLSSDEYQLVGNSELFLETSSNLRLDFGPFNLSSISAADDVALVTMDLHTLQSLLNLCVKNCEMT